MDLTTLVPHLVQWGPAGIIAGIALYLYREKVAENDKAAERAIRDAEKAAELLKQERERCDRINEERIKLSERVITIATESMLTNRSTASLLEQYTRSLQVLEGFVRDHSRRAPP